MELIMPKKQDVTVVSDLVGRANFTVSAKGKMVDGVLVGAVPSTNFSMEVTYKDQIEKMEYAVPTSVICLQGFLRDEYLAHGKFSFPVGTMIKVGANGRYTRPAPMPTRERLLAASWAEKIAVAETYGLAVPDEWRAALANENSTTVTEVQSSEDKIDATPRYNVEELRGQSLIKLRVLAQNEELEGYAELTKEQLVEELALLVK